MDSVGFPVTHSPLWPLTFCYPALCNFLLLVRSSLLASGVGLLVQIPDHRRYGLRQGRLSAPLMAHLQRTLQPIGDGDSLTPRGLPIRLKSGQFTLWRHRFGEGPQPLKLTLYSLQSSAHPLTSERWQLVLGLEQQLQLYLDLAQQVAPQQPPMAPPAAAPAPPGTPLLAPLLSEFALGLQECLSDHDLKILMRTFLPQLFPGSAGRLFCLNGGQESMDQLASWGHIQFLPDLTNCSRFPDSEALQVAQRAAGRCQSCQAVGVSQDFDCILIADPTGKQPLGLLQVFFPAARQPGSPYGELFAAISRQLPAVIKRLQRLTDLADKALRDSLTGLLNRRYLEEVLTGLLERTQRHAYSVAIILLDIDHFKQINDVYGHLVGDEVLRNLGVMLRGCVRPHDMACRYGGEEFCLVMPETSLAIAVNRAEKIRRAIKYLTISRDGQPMPPITLSLGVACAPEHGSTVTSLISQADRALYQAKAAGRDRVVQALARECP